MTGQPRYVCNLCKQRKTADHFYSNRRSRDGVAAVCKMCNGDAVIRSKYRREFLKNPEAFKAKRDRHLELYKMMTDVMRELSSDGSDETA